MNAFDLLLLALLVVAVAGGLRVGFLARALAWVGVAAGVLLSTRTVPGALSLVEDGSPGLRFVVAVAAVTLTVSLCGGVLGSVGGRLRRELGGTSLPRLDRIAGGVLGAALVLGGTWFLLPAAAEVPGALASAVRGSAIAGAVRTLAPEPPEAAHALGELVDSSQFPEIVADLSPPPEAGVPPGTLGIEDTVVERARAASVRVSARGCGRRFDGSGVTVAPHTVLTNAHVVAGSDSVSVLRPDGEAVEATVVAFDPDRDLAVLEAPGLAQDPLSLGSADVGASGAAIGYPGGQTRPRVAPVVIEDRRTALGRDIYGLHETRREVLFLAASLRQGDSGSPVVDADGEVVGLVFAISPDRRTTAYALDRPEIEAVLAAPRVTGDTGRCVS